MQILNHNSATYRQRAPYAWQQRNGAYYYSKEICDNIIPRVQTNRPWVTVNDYKTCFDDAIVFIHNNLHPENYEWLAKFKNLVLVCSQQSTCDAVAHLGRTLHLPLSIDIDYVRRFAKPKQYECAFVGRRSKMSLGEVPEGTVILCGMPRELLLAKMACFEQVYAVGRCALEALALDCKLLAYDYRFPDTSVWKLLDNKEAAKILQEKLNEIDKG